MDSEDRSTQKDTSSSAVTSSLSDEQLIKFLGIDGNPMAQAVVDALSPQKRALYDRMATIEIELDLWQQGLGPKPQGVLVDFDRKAFR